MELPFVQILQTNFKGKNLFLNKLICLFKHLQKKALPLNVDRKTVRFGAPGWGTGFLFMVP